MGLLARWREFALPIIILSLSFFFIIYETTMFGVALTRTYSIVKLLPNVDVWVMDQNTKSFSQTGGLSDQDLFKIKSLEGVSETSPLYIAKNEFSSLTKRRLDANIVGIDLNTSFAFPINFTKGKPQNLHYESGILVDGLTSKKLSLRLGSRLKSANINSTIVGIFSYPKRIAQPPLVITSIDWAKKITKNHHQNFPFILIKKNPSTDVKKLKVAIEEATRLKAFDKSEFSKLILATTMKDTGLPHAFFAVVLCGLILAVGIILATLISISEQIQGELLLYKTLGASKETIIGLILFNTFLTVTAAIILALTFNMALLIFMPAGTFVFSPNFDIVAIITFCSFITAAIVALSKATLIKVEGALKI